MKMYYCKWTKEDVEGLQTPDGTVILYAEIDDDGNVRREIGINKIGQVVHRFPSALYRYGQYGLFDNQKVMISDASLLITKEEFERLWERE